VEIQLHTVQQDANRIMEPVGAIPEAIKLPRVRTPTSKPKGDIPTLNLRMDIPVLNPRRVEASTINLRRAEIPIINRPQMDIPILIRPQVEILKPLKTRNVLPKGATRHVLALVLENAVQYLVRYMKILRSAPLLVMFPATQSLQARLVNH
jgi:hypothetical protein